MKLRDIWPRVGACVSVALIAWLARVSPLLANVLVRVNVTEAPRLTVGSSTAARILDSSGQILDEVDAMTSLAAIAVGNDIQIGEVQGNRLMLQPATTDGSIFINDTWYRGTIEIVSTGDRLMAINHVDLEVYVASVIGSEMGGQFPLEALKSQAVATRTFALYNHNKRLNQPFDVGDDSRWQVYKGIAAETSNTAMAAQQTTGQVLTHNGQLINAVYHADSGGATENSEHVWSSPLPYLKAVSDRQWVPSRPWEKQFSAQEVQREFVGIGSVTAMEVEARSPQGRVRQVRITGSEGSVVLTGKDFRQRLQLRSTMFEVEPGGPIQTASTQPVAVPPSFIVKGYGYGHGVGMSQWGAAELAKRNWTHEQILQFYYKDIGLSRITE
ncbi:MAG: SpoIID/LytB domain-containing protein [Cyanobacteria bacterium P01_F01_bin.33]